MKKPKRMNVEKEKWYNMARGSFSNDDLGFRSACGAAEWDYPLTADCPLNNNCLGLFE